MEPIRSAIQNYLRGLADKECFIPVRYDNNTALATAKESDPIKPSAVASNEERSTFVRSRNKRSGVSKVDLERRTYRLILEFREEVDFSLFEATLMEEEHLVEVDDVRVWLILSSSEYSHPPRQQQEGGSHAVFDFDVWTPPH